MSYHLLTKPAIHSFNNNKHVARQECQNDYTRPCRCWAYGEKGEKVIAGMCYQYWHTLCCLSAKMK